MAAASAGRAFAAGAAAALAGAAVGALVAKQLGYPIAALGLLLVAYAGVQIALDRDGAARAFAERVWTEQGISVPAPLLQMRIIGVGMAVVGAVGAAIVLAEAFR